MSSHEEDLSGFSMHELFGLETENQKTVLTGGLLTLEQDPHSAQALEELMRAAHSLKGAARIVGVETAVRVAHGMEDCFVAAQEQKVVLLRPHIDQLFACLDLLQRIAQAPEDQACQANAEVDSCLARLAAVMAGEVLSPSPSPSPAALAGLESITETISPATPAAARAEPDRFLRVTAENLNRLLGLAGESLVESRRLRPYAASLQRLKRQQAELARLLESLGEALGGEKEKAALLLREAQGKLTESRSFFAGRLAELEAMDGRLGNLSQRLYDEALASRMRPFADGIQAFPRMVRDLGRSLGKEVRLQLRGESTRVDREMLERLEAPLTHLLRNAVDHGLEQPEGRRQSGKPLEGSIVLEARHSGGMLQIVVEDDGGGIDPERIRQVVKHKKMALAEVADQFSAAELMEFLFLPGFTMKETVTEISGRGVGLDVVQSMVKQVRGTIRVQSQPGRSARFQLQLPLTLSVVRTLLVTIDGEPYAIPMALIHRTLKVAPERIETVEGREHFTLDQQRVGLVSAHQVLERANRPAPPGGDLAVVVLGGAGRLYGVVVDWFLGERELVVQPLDARLGKVKDISAGALMEDGSPVLILDVDDLLLSIEKLVTGGRLSKMEAARQTVDSLPRKRVLVVDDSLTVRELERKLLEKSGYEVEVAVDGMNGWNAVRTGEFHLVITDIDMPRMDGIELVTLIKKEARLSCIPVMIVSYKDREEDRRRGLEAGADYYLTKGSFHDEALLHAVVDLIGEAGT